MNNPSEAVDLFKQIGFSPKRGDFVNTDTCKACLLGAMLIEKLGVDLAYEECWNKGNATAWKLGKPLGINENYAQGLNDGWEGLTKEGNSEKYSAGYLLAKKAYALCCENGES